MLTTFRGFGDQFSAAVTATLEALRDSLPENEVITPVQSGDQIYPALDTETGLTVTSFTPAEAFIQIADSVQTRDHWEEALCAVAEAVANATGLVVGVFVNNYGETEAVTCAPNENPMVIGAAE